ncbi:hypothetical protein DE146DRAFT_764965 [Phaeosphaeria sp. MPI-PUGE-AT-0046c]|nr:hypothetical protein DE146DRAFT_764965 [Phaeosphaeria sp. MPI-PUGE-AT-0046c]
MADTTGIQIHIGSAYGPPTAIEVSSRARNLCPSLRSLAPGSSLPTTDITPFRTVLSYLDGDAALTEFTHSNRDTSLLLLFATTWTLAARLHLPDLQNSLITAMAGIYVQALQERHSYPADPYVDQAFRHLHAEIGRDSHAERFLVCFIGRTAPLIPALKKQLKLYHFDKEICEKILAEARSFAPDPIRYDIARAHVDTLHPPQYAPIEIHHASLSEGLSQAPSVHKKDEVQEMDCIASTKDEAHNLRASCVPVPSVVSVSSHNIPYVLSPDLTKSPAIPCAMETLMARASTMTLVGKCNPLRKLKKLDDILGFPVTGLMVFSTTVPDEFHTGRTLILHVPSAAATAAANAALHPPPQEFAVTEVPTPSNETSQSMPVDSAGRVGCERPDLATADAVEPEVHRPVDDDRGLQIYLPRSSPRGEQKPSSSYITTVTKRRGWLHRLFHRIVRSAMHKGSSSSPGRTYARMITTVLITTAIVAQGLLVLRGTNAQLAALAMVEEEIGV